MKWVKASSEWRARSFRIHRTNFKFQLRVFGSRIVKYERRRRYLDILCVEYDNDAVDYNVSPMDCEIEFVQLFTQSSWSRIKI